MTSLTSPWVSGALSSTEKWVQCVKENLSAWQKAMEPNRRLCLLQITDLARRTAAAFQAGELRELSDLRYFTEQLTAALWSDASTPLDRALAVEEQLAFCRGVLSHCPTLMPEEEPSTVMPPHASHTVAMLESPFFTTAYRRFSPALKAPSPLIVSAFADVCEELSSGNADFGILPLEDSSDGKIFHFYEQIDRFELHISHTCDIPYHDSGRTVRFALLHRAAPPPVKLQGEGMLECSLFEEAQSTLRDLLAAAEGCGLTLRRIDALPASYLSDGFFYHPTFRAGKGEPRIFELYLACFMPRAAVTGRYVHLNKENEL